jgi:hypothetical protein
LTMTVISDSDVLLICAEDGGGSLKAIIREPCASSFNPGKGY